ncbi:hypothetical protein SERLA73DRAFT_152513 [Serpula lacrymans var. lacrymans S7.3]|uniref:Uncharacterized protein n=1 Tax=Serpula lacrymans var. lacrymans (strain S7.3) TaxID=936435 RepID=F8PXN8_SERL3|nr:hypothetical protein SERLA73DRAFT_152513 [Serpula lacrymans var. lacrymans S7.3]
MAWFIVTINSTNVVRFAVARQLVFHEDGAVGADGSWAPELSAPNRVIHAVYDPDIQRQHAELVHRAAAAPVGFTGKVVNCSDDTSGDPHFMPFDWMHRQSYGLERRDVYMYGYPVRSTGFRPFYELRRTFKNGSGVAQNQPFNLFKPMNHTYEYNEDVDEFSFTKLDHPNPNPTRKALFFTMIAYCVAPGPRMDFVPPNYKPLDKDHKKKFDNPYDRLPGESEAAFEARVENLDAAVNETTGAGWGDSISTLQQQKRAAVKGKAKQPDAGPSKPKTRSASKAEEDGDSSDDSDDGSPVKGLNPLNVGPEFAWLEAELTTRVWFRDAPALRTKKLGNFEPIEMNKKPPGRLTTHPFINLRPAKAGLAI